MPFTVSSMVGSGGGRMTRDILLQTCLALPQRTLSWEGTLGLLSANTQDTCKSYT